MIQIIEELLRTTPNEERTENDLNLEAVRKLHLYVQANGYELNELNLYFLYDLLDFTDGV
jgi:hypothetical protein